MFMGVVADDITGSNDIGIMFHKAGCPAAVFTLDEPENAAHLPLADFPGALILNTNSRLDSPQEAYRKVFLATRALKDAGCTRFFKKTCSVFRGNIGAEFDAMLDALGHDFGVVVLGFPANGRLTLDGQHYVHGRLLHDSEFKNDPTHPMGESDLVKILSSQTTRRVVCVSHGVIGQGAEALRDHLDCLRRDFSYAICDVDGQEALQTIALAVRGETVLCGSSALAEELPAAWQYSGPETAFSYPGFEISAEERSAGVLVASGSLMPQSIAQADYLKRQGLPAYELDGAALFDPDARQLLPVLSAAIAADLNRGQDVLFHTSHDPQRIAKTRLAGLAAGLTPVETARRVSATVAEVCAAVIKETGQDRLVVAGGETSAAVCSRLGIRGMYIWKEIQPGLSACISIPSPQSPRSLRLVLKSGSFGDEQFLKQALEVIK
jgi:uncharacterized protein YgbK (DUF1537 family)